jgi:hypothetical protein
LHNSKKDIIFVLSKIKDRVMKTAIIKRDGKEIARVTIINGFEVMKWFHTHCMSCSMDWALKYEGYSYEII